MSAPYRTPAAPEAERLPRDGFAGSVVFVIFVVGLCMGALVMWDLKPASVVRYRTMPCNPAIEPLRYDTSAECTGAGATLEITQQGSDRFIICRCPVATDGGVR